MSVINLKVLDRLIKDGSGLPPIKLNEVIDVSMREAATRYLDELDPSKKIITRLYENPHKGKLFIASWGAKRKSPVYVPHGAASFAVIRDKYNYDTYTTNSHQKAIDYFCNHTQIESTPIQFEEATSQLQIFYRFFPAPRGWWVLTLELSDHPDTLLACGPIKRLFFDCVIATAGRFMAMDPIELTLSGDRRTLFSTVRIYNAAALPGVLPLVWESATEPELTSILVDLLPEVVPGLKFKVVEVSELLP